MRLGEAGNLRLRVLRGRDCEAVSVNTSGGIVGGDRLDTRLTLRDGASVTYATSAAEKCYRSAGDEASVSASLSIGKGAILHWLPQETILFDGARVRRSLSIDLADEAAFVGCETIVFGRLARDEVMRAGWLRDSLRLRRDGRLVFADESTIGATVAATLDRPAVGAGARSTALLLASHADVDRMLEPLRETVAMFSSGADRVEAGASVRDGVLVARLLSPSPERLRVCVAAAVGILRTLPPPRGWS